MKSIKSLLIVIVIVLFVNRCTNSLSGTETGNPFVVACIDELKSLFDTTDTWLPSSYLPGGEKQLNPMVVQQETKYTGLAKAYQKGAENDSVLEITIKIDTQITTRSIKVQDTIVNTIIKADTILDKQGFQLYEKLINDTVVVDDTVYLKDTAYVKYFDTLVMDKISGAVTNRNNRNALVISSPNIVTSLLMRDNIAYVELLSAGNRYTAIIADKNLKIVSDTIMMSTSRSYADPQLYYDISYDSSNITAYEEKYMDLDGNLRLFTAAPNVVPSSKLSALYTMSNTDVYNCSLQLSFDAGQDKNLISSNDNRIITMERVKARAGTSIESIQYGKKESGIVNDTVDLSITQMFGLKSRSVVFKSLRGADALDHRQNRLVSVMDSVSFLSSEVRQMSMQLYFARPVVKGQKVTMGILVAHGVLSSNIPVSVELNVDFVNRFVSGTYIEAGISSLIKYKY
jgi:hypothetical protein